MRIVLFLISTFSIYTQACPQLAAEYSCNFANGPQGALRIMTQTENGGVTTYKFHEREMIADNQVHRTQDDDTFRSTMQSWCDGDMLKSETLGDVLQNGVITDKLALKLEFVRAGDALTLHVAGSSRGNSGDSQWTDTHICTLMTP